MPRETAEPAEDSLAALLPESRPVELGGGRTIHVRELTLGEIGRLSPELRRFVGAYTGAAGAAPRDMLDLVTESEGAACAVAAATTGIPAERWRAAGASRLARVVQAAVEVNLDFFVRCVELAITLGAMAPANPNGRGSTPSATSPDAGTATP